MKALLFDVAVAFVIVTVAGSIAFAVGVAFVVGLLHFFGPKIR